jgi:hypothetical protein
MKELMTVEEVGLFVSGLHGAFGLNVSTHEVQRAMTSERLAYWRATGNTIMLDVVKKCIEAQRHS